MADDLSRRVDALAMSACSRLGMELVDTRVKRGRGRLFVEVLADHEGGFSLEDCETLSRALEELLDDTELMDGPYTLEVASPGPNRPLRFIEGLPRFVGRQVRLEVARPTQRRVTGELLAVKGREIAVRLDAEQTMEVPWEQVISMHLLDQTPTPKGKRS